MRVNLNRFLGTLHQAGQSLRTWHIECWERTFLALECDMLKGKKFETLVIKAGQADNIKEGNNSTSSARLAIDDRTLRACAQNAVAISVMMLSDPKNKRLVSMIYHFSLPLLQWHTAQNKAQRS